jgi:hypothetical protein
MAPVLGRYPWYGITSGPDIEQGDIFPGCPMFEPESTNLDDPGARSYFRWEERDAIVITQSCDLVPGRAKTKQVLLCTLWNRSDFPPEHTFGSPKGLEEARRGNTPGFHLLAECQENEFSHEVRLVDFRRTWSLPLEYLQQRAVKLHLRLLPPYREHLAQAFARYFMRVGLPIDIPPFR